MFIATFDHYLHMKRSILFSIRFKKYIFRLIAANVRDFKGNCTMAGEKFFFLKITFSNFDELQLKISYAMTLKFSANQIHSIAK